MMSPAIVIDEASNLSELLNLLHSSGKSVLISRNGQPVAELTPYGVERNAGIQQEKLPLIGLAAGKLNCPADIDFCNDEIEHLFYGESL